MPFGSLAPVGFSDVPGWRERQTQTFENDIPYPVAPVGGRPPSPPYDQKYRAMRPSENIEDRRGDSLVSQIILAMSGNTPERWGKIARNPFSTFQQIFPEDHLPAAPPPPGGDLTNSLAAQAGYWDIGGRIPVAFGALAPQREPQ